MRQATDGTNLRGQPLITRFILKVFTLLSSSSSTSFATAANTTATSAAAATRRDTQQLAQPESGSSSGPGRVESVRIHLPEPEASAAAMVTLAQRSHAEPALPPTAGANDARSRIERARAGYAATVKQAVKALLRHDPRGARHALARVWTGAQAMVELLDGPDDAGADSGSETGSDNEGDADSGTVAEPGELDFAMQALEGVPLAHLTKIQDAMRASGTELSPANLPGLPNYTPARPDRPQDVVQRYGWMVRDLGPPHRQQEVILSRWLSRTLGPVDRRDQSDCGRWLMVHAVDRLVNVLTPKEHLKKAAADAISYFEQIDGSDAGVVEKLCAYDAMHRELQAVCARLVAKWPGVDGDLEARRALDNATKRAQQGADALLHTGEIHAITTTQAEVTSSAS